MRLLINSLAIIGLIVGGSSVVELYGLRMGDSEPQGFANVTVPIWALLGALAAIVFGFSGRIMDRRAPRPASKLSNLAIGLGLLCGMATLAVPFVFS